jgi:hypothetical protein
MVDFLANPEQRFEQATFPYRGRQLNDLVDWETMRREADYLAKRWLNNADATARL